VLEGMNLPKTILVATDFSETSEAAVAYAVGLADKLGAKLYLLHAVGMPMHGIAELGVAVSASMIDSIVHDTQVALDKLIKTHAPVKIVPVLRTGDARDLIVQTAADVGADLIVLGTHGRRGVSRALLGSVAENVLRHAHCPVLTIRKQK
jgi:nucleotide-binding universal stress UspA family protein